MASGTAVLLSGLLCPRIASPEPPPWAYWSDPLVLSRHRDDHAVVLYSTFSPVPCAYGPDGAVEPGALECRYDHLYRPLGRHRELRLEGDELLLVDEQGAGALVRAWLTTGDGFSADFPAALRLRIRLDGSPDPFVDIALNDWFAGDVSPHLAPLAGNRHSAAGAGFNLVPVVFNAGMTISLAGGDQAIDANRVWYQFNIHRVAADVEIGASGFPADWPALHAFISTTPGAYPWPGAPAWVSGQRTIKPGVEETLLEQAGSDSLLGLRLRVPDGVDGSSLRLRMRFDEGSDIDHPLTDWFGMGSEPTEAPRSLLVGLDDDGFAYLFWPMPFHSQASVRLLQAGRGGEVTVDYAYVLDGRPAPEDAMHFGIRVADQCIGTGRHQSDLSLLALGGRGRWLGLSTRQHNLLSDNANYLEGDERIHIDGSAHPALHGTGNEDFYNAGFYFDHGGYGYPFAAPMTGAPWHQRVAGTPVASRMYRLLLADAVPFRSSLDVRLERGAYGDQAMCADATAWFYHEPGRAMLPVSTLDLVSASSIQASHYVAPASASCSDLSSHYIDEPPTQRSGRVCRFSEGTSSFRFHLRNRAQRLWLRRRFDALEGGQAAIVVVNGQEAGRFPYAPKQPWRRWQEVDLPLAMPPQPAGSMLDIRIVPIDSAALFTEAAYTLLAPPGDLLHADGFDPVR
ncbi:DUF2961 domain-containing protein [Pseudofulvimonas gallinarii]|uniref:DUF2961 family protein n=1 Tax=Pseudofulvimonas gallinarii TaxID=634155 RepID=A0A4R3LJJ4_9GAMM|nr:DUF2961 domain-containing protein [Pseudofulvimonas gallinarii]TCT00324.1 DUF2961 family protein [Pseudofulvimonas gallinarii]